VKIPSKYFLANLTGIPRLVNWLNRNRLLVLTYHGIYDGPKQPDTMPDTFIHVDDMVMQLKFIKKKYLIITPDDLLSFLDKARVLPPHAALITFDDGYESFYRLAEPILRSMEIKTVVFIPTRYVEQHEPFWFDLMWLFLKSAYSDNITWLSNALALEYRNKQQSILPALCLNKMKNMVPEHRDKIVAKIKQLISPVSEEYSEIFNLFFPMSGKQIKALSKQGITFGGHTHTHTILSALSKDQAQKEIITNREMLESLTGKQCLFFAYPNGGAGDFNEAHKDMLKQSGYKIAFSLTQKRSSIQEDTMNISRFHVAPEDTSKSLHFRCCGIKPYIFKIRKFII
jgi:peptidoglycan/xylan/chitin deacetylase (PgdA/CDA1 family)